MDQSPVSRRSEKECIIERNGEEEATKIRMPKARRILVGEKTANGEGEKGLRERLFARVEMNKRRGGVDSTQMATSTDRQTWLPAPRIDGLALATQRAKSRSRHPHRLREFIRQCSTDENVYLYGTCTSE